MLYTVEVMVIGTAMMRVEADCEDTARTAAEEAATVLHATEWAYDATGVIESDAMALNA